MGRTAAWIFAGLVLGFVLGWVAHGLGSAPSSSVGRPAGQPSPGAPAEVRGPGAAPGNKPQSGLPGSVAQPASPLAAAAPAPSPSSAAADRREQAALQARLRELEAKLAQEEGARVEREGTPIPVPADLPERFEQERLRRALDAGLRQAGLRGQVSEVDCSEFPCLLFGELTEGAFDRAASQRLEQAAAIGLYRDDQKSSFGSTVTTADGQSHQLFGVAVWPKDADPQRREQVLKRLRTRWNEMQEASLPHDR